MFERRLAYTVLQVYWKLNKHLNMLLSLLGISCKISDTS